MENSALPLTANLYSLTMAIMFYIIFCLVDRGWEHVSESTSLTSGYIKLDQF